MAFAAFMAEPRGRLIRIIAGTALTVVGLAVIGGTTSWIVVAIGMALIAAGAFNVCLIAPLVRAPFDGREAAQRQKRETS